MHICSVQVVRDSIMVCVPYSVCICSVVPSVPAHNYSISGQSGVSDVSSDVCSVSSTWCMQFLQEFL